jgi:hypothetical protein
MQAFAVSSSTVVGLPGKATETGKKLDVEQLRMVDVETFFPVERRIYFPFQVR